MSVPMEQVQAVLNACAEGREAVVYVIGHPDGRATVRWGVDGLALIECDAVKARELADLCEENDAFPGLVRMLRSGADTAEANGRVLQ